MHTHRLITYLLCAVVLTAACSDTADDMTSTDREEQGRAEQTVMMFFPWSATLLSAFNTNIADMETVVQQRGGLDRQRLLIYICQSATKAHMIEIGYDGSRVVRDTIATDTYTAAPYVTADGMATLLRRMQTAAPAESYALVIGCHGMGWLPAGTAVSGTAATKGYGATREMTAETRYFGHPSDATWQCDIATLADGIAATGQTMDYILFDACYMANIETAYELRLATKLLVASPTEVMAAGVPYSVAGSYLLDRDMEGLCDAFADYYLATSTPYAAMTVVDCTMVETMAEMMSTIHAAMGIDVSTDDVQPLDGMTPHVFFDLGSYVGQLCADDASLLSDFSSALTQLVVYSRHTPTFYSVYDKSLTAINCYSGLTISAPSSHQAAATWPQTAWAVATLPAE